MTTTTQQPNGRKQWHAVWATGPRILSCWNCGLTQKEHISHIYCPEWRLRQLDGDR